MDAQQRALEQLRDGDVEALGYLYDHYIDYLLDIGLHLVNDEAWIEDQVHDLFLDLYKSRKNVLKIKDLKAYLTVSFKRRLYKKGKRKEVVIEEDSFKQILSQSVDHQEKSTESKWIDREKLDGLTLGLKSAMESLTYHQQNAIQLRYVENKSYVEIAEQMDMSVASARTLLYRSIKVLKEKVQFLLF
ncbi:MAG: sigma-70 family RNA polymerase sigma factor [Bacteroidota bacterium]|nr:sigma-70 family RNA polymerase sigma factor [Bacteroidota bacterium]